MRFRVRIQSVLMFLMVASLAGTSFADTLITKQMSGFRMPNPEQSETWMNETQLREDRGKQSLIADMTAKKIYILRHDSKSYNEFDMPIDFKSVAPESLHSMIDDMQTSLQPSVDVSPRDEKRKIGAFTTRGFDIRAKSEVGMDLEVTFWVADDVDFDVSTYKTMRAALAETQPFQKGLIKELFKIEGYPILSEIVSTVGGEKMTHTEKVVSIEAKVAPAGHYAPPGDYYLAPYDFTKLIPAGS